MADEELKRAIQSLHAKRLETAQKVNANEVQIANWKRSIKMNSLTNAEVATCPEDTRIYKGVGRMFLQQSQKEVVDHLGGEKADAEKSVDGLEKKIRSLKDSLQVHEERLRDWIHERSSRR